MGSKTLLLAIGLLAFVAVARCAPLEGESRDLLGRRKRHIRIEKRRTKNKVYQKNKSHNKNYAGVIYNPQKNAAINGDHGYIEQNDAPYISNFSGNRIYGRLLLGRKKPSVTIRKRKTKNKVYQKNKSRNSNYKGVTYNTQKNAAINGDHGWIEQNDRPYIENFSGNRIHGGKGRLLLGRKKPSVTIRKRRTKNKVYQKNKSRNSNYKGVIYNTQKNGVVNGDHSYVGQNDRPHIENFSGNRIGKGL